MSKIRPDFCALADRCEREEPSQDLDIAICDAIDIAWTGDCAFSSNLDAAVALVDEGVEWSVSTLYHIARAEVGLNLNDGPHYGEHKGALVAMSICAAALRARAAVAEDAGLPRAEGEAVP